MSKALGGIMRGWPLAALCVVAVEGADLVLYDGSHRYNTSRDTEIMSAITAPLIGSAWVMGENGEMLRNSGSAWTKFASNEPNESHVPRNHTLYPNFFVGNWAAGTAGQLLRATDSGGGSTWRTHATANRSRPLNEPHDVYSGLRSSNWAAGTGTTLARNVGEEWALFAAHDVRYPELAAQPLYGKADGTSPEAAFLGDDCFTRGQRAAAASGPFGGRPMQLQGDNWGGTAYKLYCGGASRRDFRTFDTISFYIKWCSSADCAMPAGSSPFNISFKVTTWNAASREVLIKDYMVSSVDGTWRQVSIPLEDLVTDAYDMNSVDHIQWPSMRGGVYFVDAVVLSTIRKNVEGATYVTAGLEASAWTTVGWLA